MQANSTHFDCELNAILKTQGKMATNVKTKVAIGLTTGEYWCSYSWTSPPVLDDVLGVILNAIETILSIIL